MRARQSVNRGGDVAEDFIGDVLSEKAISVCTNSSYPLDLIPIWGSLFSLSLRPSARLLCVSS